PVDVGDLVHEQRARPTGLWKVDGASPREALGSLENSFADERRNVVDPCEANLDLLERQELVARVAGHERRQPALARLDVTRHRAGVVEARREREAAVERDEAGCRLGADDPPTR